MNELPAAYELAGVFVSMAVRDDKLALEAIGQRCLRSSLLGLTDPGAVACLIANVSAALFEVSTTSHDSLPADLHSLTADEEAFFVEP